jgi:hypothetical protein
MPTESFDIQAAGFPGPRGLPGTGTGDGFPSRSALAAVVSPIGGDDAYVAEARREGKFIFSSANLSAFVSADATQGIYVPPLSDPTGASGAWVRVIGTPTINPEWFGIVPSATATDTSHAAANYTAWLAFKATLVARAFVVTSIFKGLEPFIFPGLWYHFDGTLELADGVVDMGGTVPSGHPNGVGTVIIGIAADDVLRVQGANTAGANSGAVASHPFGQASRIHNLIFKSTYAGGAEAETHAVRLRAAVTCENVIVTDVAGDGFHFWADTGQSVSGPDFGEASQVRLINCSAERCRNGVSAAGADSNVFQIEGGAYRNNRQWGAKVDDSNLSLGGKVSDINFDNNGITGVGPPTVVSYSGERYGVIIGQEVWCSTHAPSGTTADNQGWYHMQAGGPMTGIPAWVSGTTYRAGGSVTARSVNGSTLILNNYHEAGMGLPQVDSPNWIVGGVLAEVRCIGTGQPIGHVGGEFFSRSSFRTYGNITIDGTGNAIGPTTTSDGGDATLEHRGLGNFWRMTFAKWAAGARVHYNSEITSWDGQGFIFSAIVAHYFKVGGGTYDTSNLAATLDGSGYNLEAGGVYKIAGTQVLGPRQTGWTAGTGTANKAAFAAYAGATRSATYVQSEAQATDDAAKNASQRIKAVEDALRTAGMIN